MGGLATGAGGFGAGVGGLATGAGGFGAGAGGLGAGTGLLIGLDYTPLDIPLVFFVTITSAKRLGWASISGLPA